MFPFQLNGARRSAHEAFLDSFLDGFGPTALVKNAVVDFLNLQVGSKQ
jgi:hypothetical protein